LKSITVCGEPYQIQDYIPAQDMVGLNIFGMYSLVSKLAALTPEKKEGEEQEKPDLMKTMQLITDHMVDFCSIVDRLITSPKPVKPKFALIMGFISDPEFMAAFMETFAGLDKIVKGKDQPSKKD